MKKHKIKKVAQCLNKVYYHTEQEALKHCPVVEKKYNTVLDVYKCGTCEGYYLAKSNYGNVTTFKDRKRQ